MPRGIEEIIEELENCFQGHDEYILGLLAELKEAENKAVQEEREACANVCDSGNNLNELGKREIITLKRCAEAIRARGK